MNVSCCCIQNVGKTKSHNKKLISSNNNHPQSCHCRKKEDCPLDGKYRTENIIYKCIVSPSGNPDKAYLETEEGILKRDIITISVLSKIRDKQIKPTCKVCLGTKAEMQYSTYTKMVCRQICALLFKYYEKLYVMPTRKV